MNGYEKKDLAIWITGIVGAVIVACMGVTSCSKHDTQVNQIEAICYQHGGHMQKAPYSGTYMTCVGQTR